MILYHGTSSTFLDDILHGGLQCRGDSPSNWVDHPSCDDRIYLTTAYAVHFAKAACEQHGGKPLILKVVIDDTSNLVPDEDVLAQCDTSEIAPELVGKSLTEKTQYWAKKSGWLKHLYYFSLETLGTVAHLGDIPASCIEDYVVLEWDNPAIFGHDPTITIMNYKILGDSYNRAVEELVESKGELGHSPWNPVDETFAINE